MGGKDDNVSKIWLYEYGEATCICCEVERATGSGRMQYPPSFDENQSSAKIISTHRVGPSLNTTVEARPAGAGAKAEAPEMARARTATENFMLGY